MRVGRCSADGDVSEGGHAEVDGRSASGEADGLNVSLSADNNKIAQLEESARRTTDLGMPRFHDVAPHTVTPKAGPQPAQGD